MRLRLLDLIVVATYLALLIVIGARFAGRIKTTSDYFLAGRKIKYWAIGLSIFATNISCISFIAIPADSFKTSWLRWLSEVLRLPIGVPIVAWLAIPFFYRAVGTTTTAYQYLEERFGPSIRLYASGAFILDQLLRVSIITYLLGVLLAQITGYDLSLCIVVTGLVLAFYTTIGGIAAVVWMDVLQAVTFIVGALAAFGIIVMRLPGGFSEIVAVGLQSSKLSFHEYVGGQLEPIPWGLSLERKTIAMMMILGLTSWVQGLCCGQDMVQRYTMARTMREARQALLLGAITSVGVSVLFYGLGTALFAFYHRFPDREATAILAGELNAERIVPHFINSQLPAGLAGLLVAAVLAAGMALDSSFNATSMVITTDIYRRFLVRHKSDRHYLLVARLVSLAFASFMTLGGLKIMQTATQTLIDSMAKVAGLLSGGLLGIYLLGFLTRRGDARAVWCGATAAALFTGWALMTNNYSAWLPNTLHRPFELYYVGIVANLVAFIVGYLGALLLPSAKPLHGLTIWHKRTLIPAPDGTKVDV